MSGPRLTERIDMWVAKFDPSGVREPRPVCENRYVEIGPISPGMAGIWAKLPLHEGAASTPASMRWPPPSATTIRAPKPSAAPMPWAQSSPVNRLACGCGHPECPAARG